MIDVSLWKAVPDLVADLLPRAIEVQAAYVKVAAETGDLAGSRATWDIVNDVIICYRPNCKRAVKLGSLQHGNCVQLRSLLTDEPDFEKEILLKEAKLPGVGHVFEFGHKMLGGPTPLANGIVSGLMLGGLGYGAGALAENLFPERYVQRGRLRKTLGLLGLGAGGALAAHNAYVNSRRVPNTSWLKGLVTPNTADVSATNYKPPPAPQQFAGGTAAYQNRTYDRNGRIGNEITIAGIPVVRDFNALDLTPEQKQQVNAMRQKFVDMGDEDPLAGYNAFDVITARTKSNAAEMVKRSFQQFPTFNHQPNLFAPTVSVPQFNAAAWNDVQRGMYTNNPQYTPPQYAAAATGLMTGISAAQRSPIIRPVDVIRGIASAGVGLATANVAGRALSALAGLTPAGQEKLQDMGLWGGMMHAIVPSMFGSR